MTTQSKSTPLLQPHPCKHHKRITPLSKSVLSGRVTSAQQPLHILHGAHTTTHPDTLTTISPQCSARTTGPQLRTRTNSVVQASECSISALRRAKKTLLKQKRQAPPVFYQRPQHAVCGHVI